MPRDQTDPGVDLYLAAAAALLAVCVVLAMARASTRALSAEVRAARRRAVEAEDERDQARRDLDGALGKIKELADERDQSAE